MRQGCVIALITEEPDDRIGHVRICGGGDGRVIGCLYPEADRWKRSLFSKVSFISNFGGVVEVHRISSSVG